jgi:hypothetical protein
MFVAKFTISLDCSVTSADKFVVSIYISMYVYNEQAFFSIHMHVCMYIMDKLSLSAGSINLRFTVSKKMCGFDCLTDGHYGRSTFQVEALKRWSKGSYSR